MVHKAAQRGASPGDGAPRTPPRRGRGAKAGGAAQLPPVDDEGDFILPDGVPLEEAPGFSPVLRKIREGKRGAAGLELSLTRGIRKARGQRVTPRKRRRKTGDRAISPAPDLAPRFDGLPLAAPRGARG